TLKDERRRRIYDDTGEVEPGAADNHYAARLMRIAAAMDEVAANAPLGTIDVPARLRVLFRQRIAQMRKGIVDLGSRAREWDEVARRLTVPEGQINVLRGLAEGKANECRRRAGEAEQGIREHEDALKLIENAGWSAGSMTAWNQQSLVQRMAATGQI